MFESSLLVELVVERWESEELSFESKKCNVSYKLWTFKKLSELYLTFMVDRLIRNEPSQRITSVGSFLVCICLAFTIITQKLVFDRTSCGHLCFENVPEWYIISVAVSSFFPMPIYIIKIAWLRNDPCSIYNDINLITIHTSSKELFTYLPSI